MDLKRATVDEPNDQRTPGSWLFESSRIILDTRSPAEFEKGHITGATSFPLFDNEERAVIGTLYKQRGKDQAVEKASNWSAPNWLGLCRARKHFSMLNLRHCRWWSIVGAAACVPVPSRGCSNNTAFPL